MAVSGRLLFLSLFACLTLVAIGSYTLLKVDVPLEDENLKVFTAEDLEAFDGSNDNPIYMGIKGVVFDVSAGKSFYGPGASYNILTGKDCSRAVAKMSLEPEDLISEVSDLSETLQRSLDTVYTGTYRKKYPIVGYMDYLVEQARMEAKMEARPHDDL